ncbi:5223_t:CDS:2, partial [Racocetra fulgida]
MTRINEVSDAISTSTLSREPVSKLPEIDQNLLLQMHLRATDQAKLNKNAETLKVLGVFVCQIIKAILIAQDNHRDTQNVIQKFDEYIIDLEIPTRLGVVKSLAVRELL